MHVSARTGRLIAWVAALLTVGVLFGLGRQEQTARTDGLAREQTLRNAQFCHLINATHQDRIDRFNATVQYLKSPVGHERNGLNKYIRKISLPQSRAEIAREAELIPAACR